LLVPYKAYICRTTDNFKTADTIFSITDSINFRSFSQALIKKDSIIVAYWEKPESTVVSYDSGNSFENLSIVGYEDDLRFATVRNAVIIDDRRIFFNEDMRSRWCIYDRETGSGIEYADIFEDTQMKIYPNIISNNESVTVELESSNGQEITFEILDYTGRCIEKYTETCTNENLKINYEPEKNLASGMYLMTASSGGKLMAAQKFIIRER
jgi:hypothetical protein